MVQPTPPFMSRLPLPFGPFEPVRRLGAGGMAETFEAIRRGPGSFEQRVCIKRVLPAFEDDREFVEAFLREATTSAQLRHANIVQVLDFGLADGSHYLALELVEGVDLRSLTNSQGPLPAELVTLIAMDLASALLYAHAGDGDKRPVVVHRDLSPSNVLVSASGEVKLVDFGIAKALGGTHRTATGVIKGKVPYLPPEYIEHATFDPRGDLFSLGVVLFELLAGQRPFDGASDFETIRRIVSGTRPALSELCPDAPAALVACIEDLLSVDPDRRTISASHLLEKLPLVAVPAARRQLADLVRTDSPQPVAPHDAAHERTVPDPARPRTQPAPAETRTMLLEPAAAPTRARVLPWAVLVAGAFCALTVLGLLVWSHQLAHPGVAGAGVPPKPERAASTEGSPAKGPVRALYEAAEAAPAGKSAERAAPAESSETLRLGRSAQLRVVAIPFGDVWIDGKAMGHAPVETKLAPGSHEIEVGDGQPTLRRTMQLLPGETQSVIFRVDAE